MYVTEECWCVWKRAGGVKTWTITPINEKLDCDDLTDKYNRYKAEKNKKKEEKKKKKKERKKKKEERKKNRYSNH